MVKYRDQFDNLMSQRPFWNICKVRDLRDIFEGILLAETNIDVLFVLFLFLFYLIDLIIN
jgi:hypothetical protein